MTNPDLVHRFVAATINGMKYAFADPAEAGAIMHKYHPQVDAGIAEEKPRRWPNWRKSKASRSGRLILRASKPPSMSSMALSN